MNTDVVILDCKIILNPDSGDQPKMINKLSYHWVGVAFTSLKFSFMCCRLKQNIPLLSRQWVIWVTLYLSSLLWRQPTMQTKDLLKESSDKPFVTSTFSSCWVEVLKLLRSMPGSIFCFHFFFLSKCSCTISHVLRALWTFLSD